MYTLGINAVFHDSSACIIKDGQLLAAAEDERFTHIKHGKRPIPFNTYEIPFHAIDYCLKTAGIHLKDVDHIAYSFDPYLIIDKENANDAYCEIPFVPQADSNTHQDKNPWENLFISAILHAPAQLADGWPHHLQNRFHGSKVTDWEWHFVNHHTAHAASAFFPSPYHNAAILTLDGRGETSSTTYSIGNGTEMKKISEVPLPHSLGLLYERITTHLGFLHSSDEYKVMALASYGNPVFANDFREIINVKENGNYTIENENLIERFGPTRLKDEPFTSFHFDLARSLQFVLEETVLKLVDWLYEETKQTNLVMAGGVALNCVLNARIRDLSKFENVWVQPAAGDSGTALGAAMFVDINERNVTEKEFVMDHAYWGPAYSDQEIERFLKWAKVPYRKMENVAEETAQLLAENQIIGWFQGRMEFGPRALGSRSILASPIDPGMQSRLNEVKDREDFRPVAPVVLQEDAHLWFKNAKESPYMLFIYDVLDEKADQIPAVKHTDGTARIQTINQQQHPEYYQLIKAFKEITGVPVLVNTSFNTLGKPIVCTPRDAIECFWTSPFDSLIIGSYLITKHEDKKDIGRYSNLQKVAPFA
ncbi:carbamoyltransferase family protein [Pedobacter mucosus]|uniref:carbamoyltransferase family protein n=1 Tax=Pedobacter mucosus TaxID=2895286 RepID=UPI001EE4C5B1|nr:carbamoyltransferase C-terminal domain-containing protein [Pedobacter mucosus]UKT62592.1 carbamoyltransferase [Pedobacter mucosus]